MRQAFSSALVARSGKDREKRSFVDRDQSRGSMPAVISIRGDVGAVHAERERLSAPRDCRDAGGGGLFLRGKPERRRRQQPPVDRRAPSQAFAVAVEPIQGLRSRRERNEEPVRVGEPLFHSSHLRKRPFRVEMPVRRGVVLTVPDQVIRNQPQFLADSQHGSAVDERRETVVHCLEAIKR